MVNFIRLQIIVNYRLLIKASDKCKCICICNVLNDNINKVAAVLESGVHCFIINQRR